jgi:hypothetical protein
MCDFRTTLYINFLVARWFYRMLFLKRKHSTLRVPLNTTLLQAAIITLCRHYPHVVIVIITVARLCETVSLWNWAFKGHIYRQAKRRFLPAFNIKYPLPSSLGQFRNDLSYQEPKEVHPLSLNFTGVPQILRLPTLLRSSEQVGIPLILLSLLLYLRSGSLFFDTWRRMEYTSRSRGVLYTRMCM